MQNQYFPRKNQLTVAMVTVLAFVLTACGGGGSSGSSSSTTSQVTSVQTSDVQPTVASTTTITNPQSSSVNATSVNQTQAEKVALNLLNEHRQKCGFGTLTINQNLNNSAINHAKYLAYASETNQFGVASHYEGQQQFSNGEVVQNTGTSSPYYSGYDVKSRLNPSQTGEKAITTTYQYQSVVENIGLSQYSTSEKNYQSDTIENTTSMLQGLLAAPYHMKGLLSPQFSEIGLSYQEAKWTENNTNMPYNILSILEIVSASPRGYLSTNTQQVLHYPCDGVTTDYRLDHEDPNPFGSTRDLKQRPIGQPIYVLAPNNVTISHASATLTDNATKSTIYLNLLNRDNDPSPNKSMSANEVIFMPDTPLKANHKYDVTYHLTYATGERVSKSFSFHTKQ